MALRLLTHGNLNFLMGLIVGFTVSLLLTAFSIVSLITPRSPQSLGARDLSQHQWRLPDFRDLHAHETLDRIHGDAGGDENVKEVKFEDMYAHHDDDSKAKEIAGRVRVLVWVMTSPDNLDQKAVHVRNTWGKRADTLLFMSSKWNSTFPAIGLNVSEGREHLTAKTMKAFRYVYEHHFDDADWFMKADDDTYVIVENLRYLLSSYSPQDPIYFGHAFRVSGNQDYASGGAGYVISKEALRRLATQGVNNETLCTQDGENEDLEVGKCFTNLGVDLLPSVDKLGRSRFHSFEPFYHVHGEFPDWYKMYDANGAKSGIESLSDYAISFHYVGPLQMYQMEYSIYHLRPFGISFKFQSINLDQQSVGNHTLRNT